ncbi:MAG: LpqN/LpqT family lipoprotein [Microbacterium sp.]|uniref:LpqN/LpqT family lipoprotein n=1 Tax=Microbacterium sp. TaxID=51671 RepID=UPI001AC6054F|nr:LpqN/LpqT family lipoprotein [Microbacterium sp.]MBN9155480.1 LpqN/LpqT family lipoprotein [Microbacterium sp.]MBN9181875.1 LpqN/LpqT family lipoprotein [Microbacterium sp.]
MTEASFPSAAFPDFPAVTIEHPAEWSARPVPGALLAVIDERDAATFSPNVIVGVTRVGADHTLADEVAAVADYVTRLPEVATVDNAPVDFGGRTWGVAEFAYRAEGAGSVVQVIAVTVVPTGDAADVVRITGTAGADDYETSLPVIRGIVASARVAAR